MIADFFKALGTTLVLTANVWGAMAVLFLNNKISMPNRYNLYKHAVKYSNFVNIHGKLLLFILLLIVLQFVYVLFHFKESTVNTMVTMVGVIILILASKLMPWEKAQSVFPSLTSSVQFAYRIIVGAVPLILLGIGISATKLMDKNIELINILAILGLVFPFAQNLTANYATNLVRTTEFLNPKKVVIIQTYSKITKNRSKLQGILRNTNDGQLFKYINHLEPDYLPYTKHASNITYQKEILNKIKHYHYDVKGSKLILTWHNKRAKKRTLPIVMYKQSRLILNGKMQTNFKQNTIAQPIIKARKGKNTAILQFITPIWFKILLVINILAWLVLIIYGARYKKKRINYSKSN